MLINVFLLSMYGFGEGSAIMTRLVGTFLLAALILTSIEGAWLCLSMVL